MRGMSHRIWSTSRRELMAGLGATLLAPALPAALAAASPARALQAKADRLALRAGAPESPVWSLSGPELRFRRGESPEIMFANDLPVAVALDWRGIDGVSTLEPLLGRAALSPSTRDTFQIPLHQAGTFLCDPCLLGDGAERPARGMPLIIGETETIVVDREEVLLIEEWRLRADGTALTPGSDSLDASVVHTINGLTLLDIPTRANQRLRCRFINGCQRTVLALRIEDQDVRVMALDGQPAEPFLARGGALVLAPGGRADVFIDIAPAAAGASSAILLHDGREPRPIGRLVCSTEPPLRSAPLPAAAALPSNGLPVHLDLRNAERFDLILGTAEPDWATPANFVATALPAFRAKTGRTVVLALTNRADRAVVFHLHGHHFRLLDRLDDGWKPFWLDTLAIMSGRTQRIAFAAEHAGRFLIEATAADWAAPRALRWYSVE